MIIVIDHWHKNLRLYFCFQVRVKNLGYNCFMCYPCNYIMCLKCCQRVREDQGGIPAGVSSTSSERGGAAAAASGSTDLPQPSAPPKEVVGTGKPKGTSSFPMTSSEQMPPPPSYNEAMNQEDMVWIRLLRHSHLICPFHCNSALNQKIQITLARPRRYRLFSWQAKNKSPWDEPKLQMVGLNVVTLSLLLQQRTPPKDPGWADETQWVSFFTMACWEQVLPTPRYTKRLWIKKIWLTSCYSTIQDRNIPLL